MRINKKQIAEFTPCRLNYIRKTYIIDIGKGEDFSTRDEHGHFTGSVPHGSGSSGGGASIAKPKLTRGKYPTSDEEINSIIHNELSGIKFSVSPVYNSRIGSAGKTKAAVSPSGRIRIKSIEIGKQYRNTKEALIDTIIHEELEARILTRSYHSKNTEC